MHPKAQEHWSYVRELGLSLDSARDIWRGQLQAGQMLMLNNTFWFHGRERFKEHPRVFRHLVRVRGRFG